MEFPGRFSGSRYVVQLFQHQKNNKEAPKDIFFTPHRKHSRNKQEKEAGWKEVLVKAQSIGLATAERDWAYARDHIFGLWKSRTLAKRDNAKRIEIASGGQSLLAYDAVDICILDILGSDVAPVAEESSSQPASVNDVASYIESQNSADITPQLCLLNEKIKSPQKQNNNNNSCRTIDRLKIAILETELYKNKLQILELEKSFGLKRSKFTENLESV